MAMSPRLLRPKASGLTDPDAKAYVAAVQTADGQTLEPAVAKAIEDFIKGCKSDGIFSAIKAACILMGARTLSGALTPLVGTAPTNNNFVSGDYNRKTGLVGNGTTKYLNSNRSNSADPQNSRHVALYASSRHTANALYISTTTVNTTGDTYLYQEGSPNFNTGKLSSSGTPSQMSGTNFVSGFYGGSRGSASSVVFRRQGADVTQSVSSVAPLGESLMIYGRSGLYSNARLAFYSIGESLSLSQLDSRVSTLYTAIGAAIP